MLASITNDDRHFGRDVDNHDDRYFDRNVGNHDYEQLKSSGFCVRIRLKTCHNVIVALATAFLILSKVHLTYNKVMRPFAVIHIAVFRIPIV